MTFDPKDPVLDEVRRAIGHLPGTHEEVTWGTLTLRVGRKLFGVFSGGIGGAQRSMVFKPVEAERACLEADPRISRAPHFSPWLTITVNGGTDWAEVRELLTDSYALVAPNHLATLVGGKPR
jgi:predicted DNA-binding protein (MmcQ/YjbR family)